MADKLAIGFLVLIVSTPFALFALFAWVTVRELWHTLRAGGKL